MMSSTYTKHVFQDDIRNWYSQMVQGVVDSRYGVCAIFCMGVLLPLVNTKHGETSFFFTRTMGDNYGFVHSSIIP